MSLNGAVLKMLENEVSNKVVNIVRIILQNVEAKDNRVINSMMVFFRREKKVVRNKFVAYLFEVCAELKDLMEEECEELQLIHALITDKFE